MIKTAFMTRFVIVLMFATALLLTCKDGGEQKITDSSINAPSVNEHLANRSFPSIFQAWGECQSFPNEDEWKTMARHDLVWHTPYRLGLEWEHEYRGLATVFKSASLASGESIKQKLLGFNPNIILIAEIRWRDAHRSWMPEDHTWWMRDSNGVIVPGWEEGGYWKLNYKNQDFREHVAMRAAAAIQSGVFDGVFYDWGNEDRDALADIMRRTRQHIGDDPLIIANTNHHFTDKYNGLINGVFMETYTNDLPNDEVRESLLRFENNLKSPVVNCLEGRGDRGDLQRMRAYTTLALTHSNGFVLYGDPNSLPTPDHQHDWYPFWDANLGKPTGERMDLSDEVYQREFEHGTVIYNHKGAAYRVVFEELRLQVSTGKTDIEFLIPAQDGDIFRKE